MNKRGDIPITVLVVGVIAICALAIVSFLTSSFKLEKSFTEVTVMEDFNARLEEHGFYLNQGVSQDEIENTLNISNDYLKMEKRGVWVEYDLVK